MERWPPASYTFALPSKMLGKVNGINLPTVPRCSIFFHGVPFFLKMKKWNTVELLEKSWQHRGTVGKDVGQIMTTSWNCWKRCWTNHGNIVELLVQRVNRVHASTPPNTPWRKGCVMRRGGCTSTCRKNDDNVMELLVQRANPVCIPPLRSSIVSVFGGVALPRTHNGGTHVL